MDKFVVFFFFKKGVKRWKRRAKNLLVNWQAAESTSAGEYATLIFIME